MGARLVVALGKLQREGDVIHLVVDRLIGRDDLLRDLGDPDGGDMPLEVARADEVKKPGNDRRVTYTARPRHPRDEAKRALFPSRDFH